MRWLYPVEHIVAVLHGEIHDITLYFLAEAQALCLLVSIGGNLNLILLDVAVPKLTACPWNIFQTYDLAVVNDFTVHDVIGGKDMIVLHDILVTVIILYILTFPIV